MDRTCTLPEPPGDADAAGDVGPPAEDVRPTLDAEGELDAGEVWIDDHWRPELDGQDGCPGAYHRGQDGLCVADHVERYNAEQECWNGGQVNRDGVGRPCHPETRPCEGIRADCCKVDAKLYGAQCVHPCRRQSDCGPASWCHTLKGFCMRGACQRLFEEWYPRHQYDGNGGFPCHSGAVNATGLGARCTAEGGECDGLSEARECLGEPGRLLRPNGPASFCTFTCAGDADCGEAGTCIRRNGPPYFCAPVECAGFFEGKIFRRFPHAPGLDCSE